MTLTKPHQTLLNPPPSCTHAYELSVVIDQWAPPMTPLWIKTFGRPPDMSRAYILSFPDTVVGPGREATSSLSHTAYLQWLHHF
jgi:hypothetical protein